MQKSLSLATLFDLDGGKVAASIDRAIRAAMDDLDDRGDDGQEREVQITMTFKRLDDGMIVTDVWTATRIPRHRDVNNPTLLLFQDGDASNPDQRTLDEIDPARFREKGT